MKPRDLVFLDWFDVFTIISIFGAAVAGLAKRFDIGAYMGTMAILSQMIKKWRR